MYVYDWKTFFNCWSLSHVLFRLYMSQRHISKLRSVFGAVLETMAAEALARLQVGRCSSFSWRSTQQATFMVLFTSMGSTEIFIQPAFDLPELPSHIPYATAETLAFQDAQNRNLAVICQSHFCDSPPLPPTLHFIPSCPHPCPESTFLHIFRYNYGGSLQMFLFSPPQHTF